MLTLIQGPASEPVDLPAAKIHAEIETADDDTYITELIKVARQVAEKETGRALLDQTWELALDAFESEIILPKPPLIEVVSVKYIDTDGVQQTVAAADYQLQIGSQLASLRPAYGASWPCARKQYSAVQIRYRAGYTDADSVPSPIKQAIYLLIRHYYENRDVVAPVDMKLIPRTVDSLLSLYEVTAV